MERSSPCQVFRATIKAECSEKLGQALVAERVGQIEVGVATGIDKSTMQRIVDPNDKAALSLADVVVIGRRGYPQIARRMLGWAADSLGLRVEDREGTQPARSWLGALGTITDRAHAVTSALITAMSPSSESGQDISDAELELIEQRIAEAEVALAEARSLAHEERARREGGQVVSISGGKRQ